MSEASQEWRSNFSLPDDFLSKCLIVWPTQFFMIRSAVESYNKQFWTDLNPIQVANHLKGEGYQILTIPEESDSNGLVLETAWVVNESLGKDWKIFVSEHVLEEWWDAPNAEIEVEAEKVINILLGGNVEIEDSDKRQYDFFIDYFFDHEREIEDYICLKPYEFSRLDAELSRVEGVSTLRWLCDQLKATSRGDWTWRTGLVGVIRAYEKELGNENQEQLYHFIRKVAFIAKYVCNIWVILEHPRSQERTAEMKIRLEEEIIPEMNEIGRNGLSSIKIWEDTHISYVLRELILYFVRNHISENPQGWDISKIKTYIKKRIYHFDSGMIDICKQAPESIGERIPWFNFYEAESVSFSALIHKFLKLVLDDSIDIWEAILDNDLCGLDEYAAGKREKRAQLTREADLEKKETQAAKRVERFAFKDSALQYMFWRIQHTLEDTKWNIQEAVKVLKADPESDFNKLVTHHNISAIDMVESQLERIEWERSNRWVRKNDTRWQAVCSVLAEFRNIDIPILPQFLQADSANSRIALSILSYDKAETEYHLPEWVYQDSVEAYFQNVSRVEEKRDADRIEQNRSAGFDDDFMNYWWINRNSDTFYKFTSAVPAWWLTPDWKKLVLLKDDIWTDIRKSWILAKDVLWWFDALIAQCTRQFRGLDALEASWVGRLQDSDKTLYQAKKNEFETLFSWLGDEYKELFSDEYEIDLSFRGLMSDIRGEWEESDLEKCFRLKGELEDMKTITNSQFIERRNYVLKAKGDLEHMRELYEEQFVWTREQRQNKRDRQQREKEERMNRGSLFARSSMNRWF